MSIDEIEKVRHAYSLIRELSPDEDGFMEAIEEAADTLAGLLRFGVLTIVP